MENLELLYSLTADDGKSEKDLQNTIKKLKLILEKNDDFKINVSGFSNITEQFKAINNEAKKFEKTLKGVSNLKLNIFSDATRRIDFQKQTQQLNKLVSEIKKAESQIQSMNKQMADSSTKLRELEVYKSKTFNSLDNRYSKGDIGIDDYLRLSKMVRQLSVDTQDLGIQQKEISNYITITSDAQKRLNKHSQEEVKILNNKNESLEKRARIEEKIAQFQRLMDSKVRASKEKYTGLGDGKEYDRIMSEVNALNPKDFKSIGGLNDAKSKIKNDFNVLTTDIMASKRALDLTNRSAVTFAGALQNAANKFGIWSTVTVAWYKSIQGLKNGLIVMKDFNSAMVDLKRVTNESRQTYAEYEKAVSGIGRAFAKTGIEVARATTTFARMGYSLKEATDIAKEALLLSNVGDMGVEDASNAMISAVKGFDIPINKIAELNDAMNELGNTMPITVAGLSDALQRSASVMSFTGNSYQETLALISAANGVVQNPEKIGNALKTISLRVAGSKDEETGEDYSEIVPKLEQDFARLGIQIQDTEGNLKSTYQVLVEMGKAFKNSGMTDLEKTNMLETIAGKYNVNVAAAIVDNYADAEKALNSALNSAGSAQKENEKYLNSVEGKLATLKNRADEFWLAFLNSEDVKMLINALTGLVTIFTKIASTNISRWALEFGVLNGLILLLSKNTLKWFSAFSGVLKLANYNGKLKFFDNMASSLDRTHFKMGMLQDRLASLNGEKTQAYEKYFTLAKKESTLLNSSLPTKIESPKASRGINVSRSISTAQKNTILPSAKQAQLPIVQADMSKGLANIKSLEKSVNMTRLAYAKATVQATLFNTVVSVGSMLAMGALVAITFKAINHFKELKLKVDDTMASFQGNTQTIDNNRGKVAELSDEYQKLSAKQNLTLEETTRLKDINNELASIFPNLISHYDNAGNAVVKYADDLERLNSELDKQKQAERDKVIASSRDIVKSGVHEKSKVESDLVVLQNQRMLLERRLDGLNPSDSKYEKNKFDKTKKELESINAEIRANQTLIESSTTSMKTLADAILQSKDNYEDLTDVERQTLENLKNSFAISFNDKDWTQFGTGIEKIFENLPDISNIAVKITPETSEQDINKYKKEISKIVKGLDLKTDQKTIDEFVSDLVARIQGKADESSVSINIKVLQADFDTLVDNIKMLDEAIQKSADGYSFSYDEMKELIKVYPELEKSVVRTADGYKIEQSALELSRKAMIENQKAHYEAEIKKTRDALVNKNSRLKFIADEIKGIKTLSDAYRLAAGLSLQMNQGMKLGSNFHDSTDYNDYLKRSGVTQQDVLNGIVDRNKMALNNFNKANPVDVFTKEQYDRLKQITSFGDQLGEVEKLQSQLDDLSKGSILGGSPDKSSSSDKTLEEIDTIDKYSNAIKELDLAINKLQSTREKLSKNSKEYKDNIKQELDLIRQKKKLTEEEIANNAKLLSGKVQMTDYVSSEVASSSSSKIMPANGQITSVFGDKRTYKAGKNGRKHEGIDINGKSNDPIFSVKSGTVVSSGWNELGGWKVSIKDEEGLVHYYAHMIEKSWLKAGDKVQAGDVIGKIGNTGYSKIEGTKGNFGTHLHYGIYKNGKAIDPKPYLEGASKSSVEANDGIKAYNKALQEQQSAFDKDIQLRNTRIELQKQEEEYLRKLAQLTIDYSDSQVEALKSQNELLSLKQQVLLEGSDKYNDIESQKLNNLTQEQLEYQRQAIEIKQLLQENERHMAEGDGQNFLTGDMIDELTAKLNELEKSYWETTVAIKDSQLQQNLKELEKFMEDVTLSITPLENALESLKTKFDLLSEIDFTGKMDVTGDMFEATKQQIRMLRDQYQELANIQPQTKEEAIQLADNLSSVADKILNANKQMIEYKRQMDNLLVDEMSYSYKNDMGRLESVLGSFQHNLKMLDGGMMDGTDISFGIGMLPEIPKSALEEKRRELDSMLDEQRAYEEEILKLREMSFDEQESKNKEFGEAIKQYMTDHYDEMVKKLADSLGIQYDEMTDGQRAILDSVKTALLSTENAYTSTWDSIVSKVTQALNTIKQAQAEAMYTYQNFDSDGNYLGVTTGKSGQSNKMDNAGKIVTETGQTWIKDSTGNWIRKYAKGTDGHKGGVALVGEEGEELAILPNGKSIMLGKSGAELVDLPAGTTVIPNEETKDLTKYLGTNYRGSKIPKYADGTIPKYAGGVLSSIVSSVGKSIANAIVNAVSKSSGTAVSKSSGTAVSKSSGIGGNKGNTSQQSQTANNMHLNSVQSGMSASSGSQAGYVSKNPYNNSTVYNYANYDETGKFMGYSSSLDSDRSNALKGATHVVSANGKIYTTEFGKSIQDRNAQQSQMSTPTQKAVRPPSYSYSSANESYYKQEKTKHEKDLDKIRYDNFLSKQMASEFNTYKSARDTNMASIKAEQEAIKKHFSDGGIRETIESQIQSLVDKIDAQTAKDIEMQFKMSKDVLEQQKKLAEDYMSKTQKAYLDGINKGISVDALRKLRDEYADAQKEFQQIEEAIKDGIKSRYDYEFALMDKRMQKYKEQQDDIGFKINVLNSATDNKDFKQQVTYNEQMVSAMKEQIQALNKELDNFKKTQNTFSVGSFEWNLFEEQIKKVNDEVKDLNLSIIQTIANNKKLETDRLSKVFEDNNKQLEKDLFGGKTSDEVSKEINKKKNEYEKYLEGVEKEYALDLLIRDLRKEEISDFDEQIDLMNQKEKITRDEYTTLQKEIEIKKLENALDKAKNNRTTQELTQKEDGTWDFVNVADLEAIKNLEDQLIQAKIDMMGWNKELEFKTADLSIQEKLDFMDRLREIQQKALNEEYKNSTEFEDDLKELGLSLSDYGEWTEGIKDSIVDSNGNLKGVLDNMTTSFDSYTESINALNARLEALLIALSVDKTINLNDAFNNIQKFDTGGYTGNFNNGRLAVLHQKELVLNQDDTLNFLNGMKMLKGINLSSVVDGIKTKTQEVVKTVQEFIVPINAIFPNANDVGTIQAAILGLPEVAKTEVNKRK